MACGAIATLSRPRMDVMRLWKLCSDLRRPKMLDRCFGELCFGALH
jgi:hypothetical protein